MEREVKMLLHSIGKVAKSKQKWLRARLRREILHAISKITNAVNDFHGKLRSWIAADFKTFLLPSFQTLVIACKYENKMAVDGRPQFEVRRICSTTAHGMLGFGHFSFSEQQR